MPQPDTAAENELLCERLLGWKRIRLPSGTWSGYWHRELTATLGHGGLDTPSFTDWTSAGLILDALAKAGQRPEVGCFDGWYCFMDATADADLEKFDSGPAAIRASALAYLSAINA